VIESNKELVDLLTQKAEKDEQASSSRIDEKEVNELDTRMEKANAKIKALDAECVQHLAMESDLRKALDETGELMNSTAESNEQEEDEYGGFQSYAVHADHVRGWIPTTRLESGGESAVTECVRIQKSTEHELTAAFPSDLALEHDGLIQQAVVKHVPKKPLENEHKGVKATNGMSATAFAYTSVAGTLTGVASILLLVTVEILSVGMVTDRVPEFSDTWFVHI
jgi:uncharacterized membrane protein YtjA (UPF0391 family)